MQALTQTMTDSTSILNNLKLSGNLPSMPQILLQLIDSCHNPDTQIQEIAHIVDKDAVISAKLLQLVNSAFIGARRSFTDVEQAVVYLGRDTVRNLAISLAVQQVFRRVETNGLLSIDRFWHHSFTNGLLARKLAVAIGYPEPAEAYLAGLLHDIGKLLLWMVFPGKYAPLLLKGIRCHNARLAFLEEEKLKVNHCTAGAWLCEQWRLPALLADAIRFHHHSIEEVAQALPLAQIVCLTDLLSHSENDGQDCLEAAELLFRMSGAQVGELYDGLEEQVEEIATQLGIPIPRSSKSSLDKEPESQEAHKEISLGLISRVRDITQLTGLLDTLLRAECIDQIVVAMEQAMKILFNEEACLVLLADAETGEMRSQVSPDNRLARDTASLAFSPERHRNSLPGQALKQQRLLYLFERGAERQAQPNLFDAQLLKLLGTDGMVAIPMIHQQQVQGMVIIGLMEKAFLTFNGQWTPLLLLANQAAIAIHLERVKAAQAERIAAERLQSAGMVARKIAHEINNPLAILRNYMHILGKKSQQNEPIDQELAMLDNELERIGRITLGLENLGREQDDIHPEPVDINRQVEDVLRLFRASLGASEALTLTFVPCDQPPLIHTDPRCLIQILQNLLGNAKDALAGQGTITVRTTLAGTALILAVEDNGPGIDPLLQADLFKAGTSTKSGRHGGLGLAIVRKLAGQIGATISYETRPGRTVFFLSLPRTP